MLTLQRYLELPRMQHIHSRSISSLVINNLRSFWYNTFSMIGPYNKPFPFDPLSPDLDSARKESRLVGPALFRDLFSARTQASRLINQSK